MKITKSSYGIEWTDALNGIVKDSVPYQKLDDMSEEEAAKDALKKTADIVFGLSNSYNENKDIVESVKSSSSKIQDSLYMEKNILESKKIKDKLEMRGIDPVGLGIVESKEIWDSMSDPTEVEKTAKIASVKFIEEMKKDWVKKSDSEQKYIKDFDTKTVKDGRIMSTTSSIGDDIIGRTSRVPINSNSLLDPNRLDKLAKEGTEHDKKISKSRKNVRSIKDGKLKDKESRLSNLPEEKYLMNSGKIFGGGSARSDSISRNIVASNRLSMFDNTNKGSLDKVFDKKIKDNRREIIEANENLRIKLKGENIEKDRSWDKVSKQLSTKDIQEKLMKKWMDGD